MRILNDHNSPEMASFMDEEIEFLLTMIYSNVFEFKLYFISSLMNVYLLEKNLYVYYKI